MYTLSGPNMIELDEKENAALEEVACFAGKVEVEVEVSRKKRSLKQSTRT
jgi:hypothetical protein